MTYLSYLYECSAYPTTPYQVMGFICIAFALILFVVGFFYPSIYAFLATAFEDENAVEGKEIQDVKEVSGQESDKIEAVAEVEDEKEPAVVNSSE
jgi:hypothetical protein